MNKIIYIYEKNTDIYLRSLSVVFDLLSLLNTYRAHNALEFS